MTTYRKKGTFRAQHAEKTGRAAQTTPLPPRCHDCRLPGIHRVTVDGIADFYCEDHVLPYVLLHPEKLTFKTEE